MTKAIPFTSLDSDYVGSDDEQKTDPALLVNPNASGLSMLEAAHVRIQRIHFVLEALSTSERSDLNRGNMYHGLAGTLDEAMQLLHALSAKVGGKHE